MNDLLYALGYRLKTQTPLYETHLHEDHATPGFIRALASGLAVYGWKRSHDALRTFHDAAGRTLEIEPGGDVEGHYLHIVAPGV